LETASNRRDLDFGTKSGKPVLPAAAVRQFESNEVDKGLFRLKAVLSGQGEYLFLILGSGDKRKGLLGKGYDFGTVPGPRRGSTLPKGKEPRQAALKPHHPSQPCRLRTISANCDTGSVSWQCE
jgi:hypothetical protein